MEASPLPPLPYNLIGCKIMPIGLIAKKYYRMKLR
jgi:hypothetical protein